MTAPGAWPPPTRAAYGVVGWARAAVIALLAALAVLIHHESVAVAIGPTSSIGHAPVAAGGAVAVEAGD
jgi:hypothetical protein